MRRSKWSNSPYRRGEFVIALPQGTRVRVVDVVKPIESFSGEWEFTVKDSLGVVGQRVANTLTRVK